MQNKEGKTIQLNRIKHKYILIDFWASWCGTCRLQNPGFVDIYSNYHSKGLEIIGISLDTKKSDWAEAISKDKLPWINVSDLLGLKGPTAEKYKIDYLPFNILVDSSYSVIATEIWPYQLKKILDYYISK